MNRRVESAWITKQKYHHGVHRVCGCVAAIAGWRSCPALAEHLLDRSRRRCPFLSSQSLAFAFQIQHTRRTCKTMRAKSLMFQIGRSEWVGSTLTSDTEGATPRALSVWNRETHTSKRYFNSQEDKQIQINRSNYPETKSGCVNDNDSSIMNNINSKFLRLTTCQAWF